VDSCGPGRSPEKRKATVQLPVSALSDARLCPVHCRIEPYLDQGGSAALRRGPASAPGSALTARPAHAGPAHVARHLIRPAHPARISVMASLLVVCRTGHAWTDPGSLIRFR
jgi:hypothetical protein